MMSTSMVTNNKHLSDVNLKIGDVVLYSSDKESTGGVLFKITEDQEPVIGATTSRNVIVKEKQFEYRTNNYKWCDVKKTIFGAWDVNGNKIMVASIIGFVRIKPLFEFFATRKGKNPTGKNKTIIISYNDLERLKKVDIVLLGTKYMELGNIIKDIASSKGMTPEQHE